MHGITIGGGYAVTKDMVWTKDSIESVITTFGNDAVLEFTTTGCKINTLPLRDDSSSFMYMRDLLEGVNVKVPEVGKDAALIKSLVQGRMSPSVMLNTRSLAMYTLRRKLPKDQPVVINSDMVTRLRNAVVRDIFGYSGKVVLLLSVCLLMTACSITPWTPPVPEPTPPPVINCPDMSVTIDYASLPVPVKCDPLPPIKLPARTIVVSKPCSIPALIETKHLDDFNFKSYQNDMAGYIRASKLRIMELELATKTIREEYTKCLQ